MSVPLTAEKKRKRDRTTDATQRKAPKLTGANEDVNSTNQTSEAKDTETHVQNTETDPLDVLGAVEHVQSAFAHIKNTKKRHRLEKEARKARKNAVQEPDTDPRHASTTQGLIATFSDRDGTLSRVVPSLISHAEDGAVSQHKPQELAIETTNEALRKPKRKKEQQIDKQHGEADEPNDLDEDEERLRKHSAVLGKFQKATQAPKDKDVVPEQESLEDEAKANVVHELAVPRVDTSTLVQKLSEQDIMPHWLAHPTLVPSDSRTAFQELRLEQQTLQRLAQLGYNEALPVQRALIPLLLPPGVSGASFLPGSEPVLPDLAVSAPTGSGKTIAYLLPIVEALRTKCAHHSVSAVIVVPTRELVAQVAAVAESLAKGSSIRVGTATGSDKLKIEQEKLVRKEQRYDPSRYEQLMDQAKRAFDVPYEDVEERRKYLEDLAKSTASTERYLHEAVECTSDHVLEYRSAVDILVATPGRLLEHITSTLGFNLTHVQWLVIDEADKILDHQNETFLEALNVALRRPRSTLEQTPRERFLRLTNDWDDYRERHVRKVILSATMTRDISKIATLELRRPRLLVVRGSDAATDTARVNNLDSTTSIIQREDNFELPRSLEEFCVPVGDGSEKTLIVLQLLTEKIFMDTTKKEVATNGVQSDGESSEGDASSESGDSSDSDSDDSSSATSVSSASYSDSESDDEGEETDNSIDSDLERSAAPEDQLDGSLTTESIAQRHTRAQSGGAATVLVFTSSNESAHRLSYLLKTLNPALGSWMTTLTKTKTAKGVNVRSKASEPAIVISTDRAARGIDSFNNRSITHVIQYDVPRSVTSYVHRVGRTARAGRHGKAWTLYTNNEARWFMNDIVKSSALVRENAVEREKIFMPDDELRKRYKTVLGEMREEVFGTK